MWTRYSDDQRAAVLAALDANGGNLTRTSRETGVPRQTIQTWAGQRDAQPVPAELRQENRFSLADLIRTELDAIFEAMHTKRSAANYKELATAAGILVDKLALIEGGPTSRVEMNVRNLPDLPETTVSAILTD